MNYGLYCFPPGFSPVLSNIEIITVTGTFYPKANVSFYLIDLTAGGGSGGSSASASGGGGGGQRIYKILPASLILQPQSVVIGSGGAGVVGIAGQNGGNTIFGNLLTALGGFGGTIANLGGVGGGNNYPGGGAFSTTNLLNATGFGGASAASNAEY